MNYKESMCFISSTYRFGIKLGLDNISELLFKLGNPGKKIKTLHIAGTNGKGSTSSFLSTILIEAGYKVGLYTSPFLENFNERIRIQNIPVSDEKIAKATTKVKEAIDKMMEEGFSCPSEFEIVTAVGFVIFEEEKVDYLVLEVGMGGSFDATNVCTPIVSIITHIAMDHMQYLGETLGEIAFEKAGIIKKEITVVISPQEKEAKDVLKAVAKEKEAEIFSVPSNYLNIESPILGEKFSCDTFKELGTIEISLTGRHQIRNALTAVTAIMALRNNNLLKITNEEVKKGLHKTEWAGRFEIVSKKPFVILDGAHNEDGWQVFRDTVERKLSGKKKTLVLGILKDKEVDKALDILLPLAESVITIRPDNERAMSAKELCNKILERGVRSRAANSIEETLSLALKENADVILYVGSLYMIGAARTMLGKKFK